MWTDEGKTFLANGALAAHRRVKLTAGTVTDPPQVEYAGAGEYAVGVTLYAAADGEPVAVKLLNDGGTFEVEANGPIVEGADLYGTANGRVDDAGTGTVQFKALEAASAAGSVVECTVHPYVSTAAASVSVEDTGTLFTATDAEGALAEIMQGVKTVQYLIAPILIAEEDGTPLAIFADGASAVPGLAQLASKEMAVRWNNHATPDAIAVQFLIPPDLDNTADLIVHLMGGIVKAGGDEVDSPVLNVSAFFSVPAADPGADVDCGGESGEFLVAANANYQEKTLIIAAADVPAAPAVLTLIINPKDGELDTDDFVLLPPWLEATRKCLTS